MTKAGEVLERIERENTLDSEGLVNEMKSENLRTKSAQTFSMKIFLADLCLEQ